MLWNWDTVDTCFIAETWHVTSKGMFAGSCIGVICLVISLELLRRLGKEYDHLLLRQFQQRLAATNGPTTRTSESGSESGASPGSASKGTASAIASNYAVRGANTAHFRPNLVQQAIRALLHTLQFAVAYFVMLLAMYFNGSVDRLHSAEIRTDYALQVHHHLYLHWRLSRFIYLRVGECYLEVYVDSSFNL